MAVMWRRRGAARFPFRRLRRRVRVVVRRFCSRMLVVAVVTAWTYPFVLALWSAHLQSFVAGRLVIGSAAPVPVVGAAVVLVPQPRSPAPEALAAYGRIDPGPGVDGSTVEQLAVWLWPDVDGFFAAQHLAPRLPYRIEVRRAGCQPVDFGVRRFALLSVSSRRLRLEVPRCPSS